MTTIEEEFKTEKDLPFDRDLAAAYTRLRARAVEMDRALQWRPIDEAPRDGSEVWAYNGEQVRMKWIEGDEYALWIYADELLTDADPTPEQPTHFRPLPPAPDHHQTTE